MLSISTSAPAFLEAIVREPDDDTHRLVHADWLDDHGDPRGEFIRLQCMLASAAEDDSRRPALADRVSLLRRQYGRTWAGPIAKLASAYEFQRGYLEWIRVDAGVLLRHADELFALAPIRELHVSAVPLQLPDLAECEALQRVAVLDLAYASEDADTLDEFLASPNLRTLKSLKIRQSSAGPRALADAHLPALEALDLTSSVIRADDIRLLAKGRLPALSRLGLSSTALDGFAVRVLCTSPLWSRLHALDLRYNFLPPEAAETLAHAPGPSPLTSLALGANEVGDVGATALASTTRLPNLRRLFLGGNGLRGPGVKELARSPQRAELTHLDLDYNALSSEALAKLATTVHLDDLQALFLRCEGVDVMTRHALIKRFGERVCRF